jgi:hypothetical protein
LTEVLLALLITVCGVLPIFQLNTVSRRRGQYGEAYAQAQVEADRLLNHFSRTLEFSDLERLLGAGETVELDNASEEVGKALTGGKLLELAALGVKRRVTLLRLDEKGLVRVRVVLTWGSAASAAEQSYQADRLTAEPLLSVRPLRPFQTLVQTQGCGS